jgi:FkbM family methyltransferase
MDGSAPRRYQAPPADPSRSKVRDGVLFSESVTFSIVVDVDAPDWISHHLDAGVYPPTYMPLFQLLQAILPGGGRVLDLGAHIGTFALAAAANGFEVLAVEASPANASVLQASIERNGFGNMRLVNAAVSDRHGTLEFCSRGPYGHVATPLTDFPRVTVPAVPVDDLLAEHGWGHVDFLKMDIEGSEVAGLEGLRSLLSRDDAPPILVESNGHTLDFYGLVPETLKAKLESFGYKNYLVEDGRLCPVAVGDLQPSTVVDYLAVKQMPASLAGRVSGALTHQEVLERVVASCHAPNADDRYYIARTLRTSPPSVLEDPRVRQGVRAMASDADERVRGAAIRIDVGQVSGPRRPWFLRWNAWRGRPAVAAPADAKPGGR